MRTDSPSSTAMGDNVGDVDTRLAHCRDSCPGANSRSLSAMRRRGFRRRSPRCCAAPRSASRSLRRSLGRVRPWSRTIRPYPSRLVYHRSDRAPCRYPRPASSVSCNVAGIDERHVTIEHQHRSHHRECRASPAPAHDRYRAARTVPPIRRRRRSWLHAPPLRRIRERHARARHQEPIRGLEDVGEQRGDRRGDGGPSAGSSACACPDPAARMTTCRGVMSGDAPGFSTAHARQARSMASVRRTRASAVRNSRRANRL